MRFTPPITKRRYSLASPSRFCYSSHVEVVKAKLWTVRNGSCKSWEAIYAKRSSSRFDLAVCLPPPMRQSLFATTLVLNIRVCPKPEENLASIIFERHGSGEMHAHFAVVASKRKRVFPGVADRQCDFPSRNHSFQFRWVVNFLPAPALHFLRCRASVVVPSLIIPEDRSISFSHPRELRDGVGHKSKAFFAFYQFRVRFLLCCFAWR